MIRFFSEDIEFTLNQTDEVSAWIDACVQSQSKSVGALSFIFCDDEYLLKINQQHLNHDYYTDVITFDYSEDSPALLVTFS